MNNNIQDIKKNLKKYTSGKCPVCYTNLEKHKSKELVKHIETLRKTLDCNIRNVQNVMKKSKSLYTYKQKNLIEIKSVEEDITNLEKKLETARVEELNNTQLILDLKTLKMELEANLSLIKNKYDHLHTKKETLIFDKKELENLRTKIDNLNITSKELKREIEFILDELNHLKTIKTIFRIQIPNILIDTCSNMFEYYCNYFLDLMEYPGLKVLIDAKPSEDGEINKILIYIMKSNGVSKLFNELSNGEKQRLVLAEILAMKQIIEGLTDVRYNILWLDEVLDASLDVVGTIKTKEMLNKIAQENNYSVELISHIQDITFDNKLTVKKENGWTNVLEN